MSSYATARIAPKTLTVAEVDKLLAGTGQLSDNFRDHCIFAVGLGTGLREHEVAALKVGDIADDPDGAARDGRGAGIRARVPLRVFKNSSRRPGSVEEAVINKRLRYKLGRFLAWKVTRGESIDAGAPLFASDRGRHMTTRSYRMLAAAWRERLGFDWPWGFHALRHTAGTAIYRETGDLSSVQRFLRHRSIETTQIYAGPSDDDIAAAAEMLRC